jgi:L-seryl-tRNA(Ser) seleniumtransferase
VWLTLAAVGTDQEVLVSRGELGNLDAGRSLPQLAAAAGVLLEEVGATNRTRASEYESAVTPRTAALLKLSSDEYRIVGETEAPDLGELVGLARDRELALIDALGAAPLIDLPPEFGVERRSVRASIAAGVDLVIVRGNGFVGGPQCGIILGNRDQVARITEHPLFAAWQLDPLRAAALTAALECYADTSTCGPNQPVLRLLATPLDNLRDRAERLAPQLARAAGIAAAEPIATRSQLSAADPPERGLASFGIALTPSDGNVQNLAKQLSGAAQSVVGRVEDSRLVLDLRTVFPRQDQPLVEAIIGSQSAAPGSAGG